MKKRKILMLFSVWILCLLSCRPNEIETNFKTGTYDASFDKFDAYYYKLQGSKLMGGTSMEFREDGTFNFHFNCTKGTYHGHYAIKNDTILLSDANFSLPQKFIIDKEDRIVGELESGEVSYIFIYKFKQQ